jgi:hypothetical protein
MEGAIKRAMHQDDKRQRKLSKGLASNAPTPPATGHATPAQRTEVEIDTEKSEVIVKRKWWRRNAKKEEVVGDEQFHPTLRDVNPFPTMWSIWKKPANLVILLASGTLG